MLNSNGRYLPARIKYRNGCGRKNCYRASFQELDAIEKNLVTEWENVRVGGNNIQVDHMKNILPKGEGSKGAQESEDEALLEKFERKKQELVS